MPAVTRIRSAALSAVLAVSPGLVVLIALFRPLMNPRDYQWLFADNPATMDVATSQLGWMYFVESAWTWPLGSNVNYGGNIANSILFSDSLPAFAIPFKLLLTVFHIDSPVQLIGPSIAVCLVLQSVFGYLLVRIVGGSRLMAFIGTWFFVLTPALLIRWNIASLFWQWLVLAGLAIALSHLDTRRRLVAWLVLLVVAAGITPYVAAMLVVIGLADVLSRTLTARETPWAVLGLVALPATVVVSLYVYGAFSIPLGGAVTVNDGSYSASLLALVDSGGAGSFSGDLAGGAGPGRSFEGFAYLGAGVLLLLVSGVAVWAHRLSARRWGEAPLRRQLAARAPLVALCTSVAALALFSLPPVITLAQWSWSPWVPRLLEVPLGAFRANGRFMWPLMYLLIVAAVVLGSRVIARFGTVVVLVALAVQLLDLWPIAQGVDAGVVAAQRGQPQFQEVLSAAFREPGVTAFQTIPAFPYPPTVPWRPVGLAAQQAGFPLTSLGYFARYSGEAVGQEVESGLRDISSGNLRTDTLYLVSRELHTQYLAQDPRAITVTTLGDWVLLRYAGSNS